MHFDSETLKAHLRQADRRGASFALIVGDDEAGSGVVILRNMRTKEQEQVAIPDILSLLQQRLFRL